MTAEQTRQLGIEFERRCQTFDQTMITVNKIDTEDIYSFLNQYQLQLVKQLYLTQDKLQDNTNASNAIKSYIRSLVVKNATMPVTISPNPEVPYVSLPENYYLYISSYSVVNDGKKVRNTLVDTKTLDGVYYNEMYDDCRIIRTPLIAIYEKGCDLAWDKYTNTPQSVVFTYLKKPSEFSILGQEIVPCELPMELFDDLVTGAVELYFSYKYKVSLASQAAKTNAKAAAKDDNDDKTTEATE